MTNKPPSDSEIQQDSMRGAFHFHEDETQWLRRLRQYSHNSDAGRVGSYELIEEAGRGGQGVVFKARQPGTGRIIAIKRLAAGLLSGSHAQARFEREIEATSVLDHPNIVTVFGAEIIDGQHLLAMKWIEGVHVDQWAASGEEGARRSVQDILKLFARVCDAVHHAHQRGVIHRDLKPSNILVDESNQPHVLDFGLAKLHREGPLDATITVSGAFVGTPAYAAPEQIRGDVRAIDVRTDVYALGTILYRLLLGQPPFTETGDLSRFIQQILHASPRTPSSLDPQLNREIDAIVLKSLAKDKAVRYQSVDALAADIRRYMTGDAVLAHPPSGAYRFQKFVLQHRLWVTAGSLLLVLLAAVAVTTSTLWLRSESYRRQADDNWRAVLQQQEERAGALRKADEAAAAAKKASELRIQGEKYTNGMTSFFLEVLRSGGVEYGGRHDIPLADALRQGIARADFSAAQLPGLESKIRQMVGSVLDEWGDFESAEPQLIQSLEIQRSLNDSSLEELALAVNILAGHYYNRNDFDKAEPLYREVLQLSGQFAVGEKRWILGVAMNDVAVTLYNKGEIQGAYDLYVQAREIFAEQLGETHRHTLMATFNVANCLGVLGSVDEALALHEEVLDLRRRTLGDHIHVARSLEGMSKICMKNDRAAEAEPLLREAVDMFARLSGPDHPHYGRALTELGNAVASLDRLEEAEAILREALCVCQVHLSPDDLDLREAVQSLAGVLERNGSDKEAREIRMEFLPDRISH